MDEPTVPAGGHRRRLVAAALAIGALAVTGFATAGASTPSSSQGAGDNAIPVQQQDQPSDRERGDGPCPWGRQQGQQQQQGSPGQATPDSRAVSL